MNNYRRFFALLVCSAVFAAKARAGELHFEIYGAKSQTDVDLLAAAGFDQMALSDPTLIDYADGIGVRTTLENWFNSHTDPNAVQVVINHARALTHLVSVNLVDEPLYWRDSVEPGFYAPEVYESIRQRHGGLVPLSLTEYGPRPRWSEADLALFRRYVRTVDLLRLSIFPIAAGLPLTAISEWLQRAKSEMATMVAVGELEKVLPLTVVLQTWNSADSDHPPQLPAVQDLQAMACLAIAEGVTAVSFFDYNRPSWDAFAPNYADELFAMVRAIKSDPARACSTVNLQ